MLNILPRGSALLLVSVAFVALAQDSSPHVRNLYLSDDPRNEAPRVYVGARIATILRFEQSVDPARTKMLGWEGRFEPLLASGRSVVLVPLQQFAPEDPFLLLVTLTNGTELPFTVASRESGRIDHQVNVFPDRESQDAVRSRLSDATTRARMLQEENERHRKEEISVDHALATLLAKDEVELTPFHHQRSWSLPGDGTKIEVRSYSSPYKTALVFRVKNLDMNKPWKLMEARMSHASTGVAWPFALRMDREEISPGSVGTIAVVADVSTFDTKNGAEKLVFQLIRADGLLEAYVVLEEMNARK